MSEPPLWSAYIRLCRRIYRLSQKDLAGQLLVTTATISRWETGKQTPDKTAQAILQSKLNVSGVGTRAYWVGRVDRSGTGELLLGPKQTVLAVSDSVLEFWAVTRDAAIASRAERFMPPIPGAPKDAAEWRGEAKCLDKILFRGSASKICVVFERVKNGLCESRAFDVWPVLTTDLILAVHFVATGVAETQVDVRPDGFRLKSCELQ